MEIKITVDATSHPLGGREESKRQTVTIRIGQDVEKLEPPYTVTVKWASSSAKTFQQFLKWLNIELPSYSAIPLLGIYPKGTKTCLQKTCMQIS